MAIILDAAIVIQGEKGLFDLNAWLVVHANEQLELAAITVAELWHGVERARPRQREKRIDYLNAVI
jgi:predicted nucleic acid-binding protein